MVDVRVVRLQWEAGMTPTVAECMPCSALYVSAAVVLFCFVCGCLCVGMVRLLLAVWHDNQHAGE